MKKFLHAVGMLPYHLVIDGKDLYLTASQMGKIEFKQGSKLEAITGPGFFGRRRACQCGNIHLAWRGFGKYVPEDAPILWSTIENEPLNELKEDENLSAYIIQSTCKSCGAVEYYCIGPHGEPLWCDKEGKILEGIMHPYWDADWKKIVSQDVSPTVYSGQYK
ncbi:MAG: hypothetical protein LBO09_02365 [Candidatus Peribacteria bacterium]|jgi:hypothetical protein|nr:hypothetical protein [Candidatus Peribacteria bacterium]